MAQVVRFVDTSISSFCESKERMMKRALLALPVLMYVSFFITGHILQGRFSRAWIPLPSSLIGHSQFRVRFRFWSYIFLVGFLIVSRYCWRSVSPQSSLLCLAGGLAHTAMAYWTINDGIVWHLCLHYLCLLSFILFFGAVELVRGGIGQFTFALFGWLVVYISIECYAILSGGCHALSCAAVLGYGLIVGSTVQFMRVIDLFESDPNSTPEATFSQPWSETEPQTEETAATPANDAEPKSLQSSVRLPRAG